MNGLISIIYCAGVVYLSNFILLNRLVTDISKVEQPISRMKKFALGLYIKKISLGFDKKGLTAVVPGRRFYCQIFYKTDFGFMNFDENLFNDR